MGNQGSPEVGAATGTPGQGDSPRRCHSRGAVEANNALRSVVPVLGGITTGGTRAGVGSKPQRSHDKVAGRFAHCRARPLRAGPFRLPWRCRAGHPAVTGVPVPVQRSAIRRIRVRSRTADQGITDGRTIPASMDPGSMQAHAEW